MIVNERNSINHAPAVDAGPDQTFEWTDQLLDDHPAWSQQGTDPDLHRLAYEWRDESGRVLESYEGGWRSRAIHGTYTADGDREDGRGGTGSDSIDSRSCRPRRSWSGPQRYLFRELEQGR